MAFRDNLYTENIQKRVNDIKDRPKQRWINEYDLGYLNLRLTESLEDDLGIVVENNGEIRNYTEDVPRMFVMKKDADGADTMMDLKTAGLERGTVEFWRQVQLGNVFAYPAGDKNPVQIQIDTNAGRNPKITYSKPVTAETLPAPPEPKKPGFFTRVGAFFSKRLRQQCQTYDNWQADQRINFNKMNLNATKREDSGKLEAETKEMKRILDWKKVRMRDDANRKIRDDILQDEELGKSKAEGLKNAVTMYQPVPETRTNLLTTDTSAKFYSKDEFNKLEKYPDLNLSEIKIGGQGLNNEDFTALAMAASMKTEYAMKNPLLIKGNGHVNSIVYQNELGMSKADADYIAGGSFDGVLSRDLMDVGNERMTNGNAIESMAVPGRRDVKNALEKYDPSNMESKRDLAKIIAFGVKHAARSLANQEGKLQQRVHNYFHMSGKLTELVDRDPDLKNLAMEEGMDLKSYKAVKGMAELDRLDTKRQEAKKTLYTAAVGDKPLDDNAKRQALKDILKANLAESTIVNEVSKTDPDPRALEGYMKLKAKEYAQPKPQDFKGNGEAFSKALFEYQKIVAEGTKNHEPYAPGGKVWAGVPESLLFGLKGLYNEPPKTAMSLSNKEGQEQLDKMVDEIIEKDKLMSLGTSELGSKMNDFNYNGTDLIKKGKLATDAIKQREQASAKQADPQLNINKEEQKVQGIQP